VPLDTRSSATSFVRHTRPVAQKLKGFCDAGMRVFKILDYGAMAGLKFGAFPRPGKEAEERCCEWWARDRLIRLSAK